MGNPKDDPQLMKYYLESIAGTPSEDFWFFVQEVLVHNRTVYLVRSRAHQPYEFIFLSDLEELMYGIVAFMNGDTVQFDPHAPPRVLALRVIGALFPRDL